MMKSSDKLKIEEIQYECFNCKRLFFFAQMIQVHTYFNNGSEKIVYCCIECKIQLDGKLT